MKEIAMPVSDYVRGLRTQIGNNLLHMPSVSTALFDTEGRLLVAQQAGSKVWMTVGGAIEPDESPSDAAVREVWEETGLRVVPVHVLGVFGGREFRVSYPNGDEAAYTVILFEVHLLGGTLRADGEEAAALRYVTAAEADALPMSDLTRILVRTSFARPRAAYLTSPTWAPPEASRG
jgi:8-oxo-dGTP pyrophosphatase MutT (NUDIX family)